MIMMRRMPGLALAIGGAVLCGCTAQPPSTSGPATPQHQASILVSSVPAAGSVVAAPVSELKLHFDPPARLDEVTVQGPDGLTPMMVHAVGEVADYSLPLPSLSAGSYTVNWKATRSGEAHQGSFTFTIK